MITGLFDKYGTPIKVGDRTRLILDDGEVREFEVCLKTVNRTVKCHPDFDDEYAKVAITGIVFCWNGYDLFPCIDENGVSDVTKMEVVCREKEDLISRQAVINLIEDLKKSPYANDPNTGVERRGTMELIKELCEHRLPTAYDVDKVVDGFEKVSIPEDKILYESPDEFGQFVRLKDAIKIAKSGGIG